MVAPIGTNAEVDATRNAAAEAPPAPFAQLDDTGQTGLDRAATVAEEIARRAEVIMLAHQSLQQDQQAKLDRMRADFNATQEERSEMLREMNALRDMAMEQSKKDDEILKKFIAMI